MTTTIPANMKRCSKCGEIKDRGEFRREKTHKDGLRSQCKSCEKAYREANKDWYAEYRKAWYKANKDNVVEYNRGWYEANKDMIAERHTACTGQLSKSYIISSVRRQLNLTAEQLPISEIPAGLIIMKRAQLKLSRAINSVR